MVLEAVLEDLGYLLDSSVPSRRLSVGLQRNVPRQFFAPAGVYKPSRLDISREGDCSILEVPPSSFFVPFNMSAIRAFGLSKLKWVANMASRSAGFLNFYIHPVEVSDPSGLKPRPHEPKRYREGLGPENIDVLEELVDWVRDEAYQCARLCEHLG